MAYTTINKHTDHFNTKLYTGANKSVTGVGFQPDFCWFKERDIGYHALFDVIRGATKIVHSNGLNAEFTDSGTLTSFDSDGFTLGSDSNSYVGGSSQATVSWNWKAGGAGSSNTDGSITSTVSANTTAGFSIVSYTGAGGNGTGTTSTVGHGLGVKPKMIILKTRTSAWKWVVYHEDATPNNNQHLQLQGNNAVQTSTYNYWNTSGHTTTTFGLGEQSDSNANGENFIAYCFAEKTGYSKFGSYVGNNNSDGTFVYTGFKPAFIIIKNTASGENWTVYDNKRASYNPSNVRIHPNLSNAESSSADLDLLSNGFKLRTTGGNCNDGTLIYMAFGQSLVGSNNVPCTAR
jgi:hypothetical protein